MVLKGDPAATQRFHAEITQLPWPSMGAQTGQLLIFCQYCQNTIDSQIAARFPKQKKQKKPAVFIMIHA